jgi:predicted membrane GTPase involved in stress response
VVKYKIPTRGLLGLRNAILTASRGTAVLNTVFEEYGPWAGDISTRDQGSLVHCLFDLLQILVPKSVYFTYLRCNVR